MGYTIKLSDDIVNDARHYASVYSRSVPKQIEYWSKIGKTAEENPDLPFDMIKGILLAKQEANDGELTPYEFD